MRILDIVGDGTYLDTSGNPIYDLYPTTGSGGFDLDAVAVIHAVPEPASVVTVGGWHADGADSTSSPPVQHTDHLKQQRQQQPNDLTVKL